MDTHTVSVVIPCYNGSAFLKQTLDSVLAQTRPVLEVLVVDDGSTDDSAAIAESYGTRVRLIRQHNQGESVARNRGIEEAVGDWIAFLDADDLWEPEKIEAQLKASYHASDAICIHTAYRVFGVKQEVIARDEYLNPEFYTVEQLLIESSIHVSSVMVRRNTPVRFPEWTKHGEDMIYFADLSLHGRTCYVPTVLAGYRTHNRMQTRTAGYRKSHLQSRFEWIDKMQIQLGEVRHSNLREQLLSQVVDWINHARWNRDWELYWELRNYAAELRWQKTPDVLSEVPWSPIVYKLKDWVAKSLPVLK